MRLVNNEVLPGEFTQGILLQITDLVGGDEAVPVSLHSWLETLFDQLGTFILGGGGEGRREGGREGR
jgi:hypothetical protein